MASRADTFDLARLRLTSGEGRRLTLVVPLQPIALSGQRYGSSAGEAAVQLSISRMTGGGHALMLRFAVGLAGPCMRCLAAAELVLDVEAREVDQPARGEELDSPYVDAGTLDLAAWARDALVLALPDQILCREDCAGLCATCGADLNEDPEHAHEREPDPRWAKLDQLRLR
jgi:uncharacterized protein